MMKSATCELNDLCSDACGTWLTGFYQLSRQEQAWVIDFITSGPSELPSAVAGQLRELWGLPEMCDVALLDPTPRERDVATRFGVE